MQSKVKDLESQLSEALKSDMTRSRDPLESQPRAAGNTVDSSAVTKKLEEELKKRDALIEVRLCFPVVHIYISYSSIFQITKLYLDLNICLKRVIAFCRGCMKKMKNCLTD